MPAQDGKGATITFLSAGVALTCTSIKAQGISWQAIDTTHLGTTDLGRTFQRADLYDPGTIDVSFHWDESVGKDALANAASDTITITYPTSGSNTEASLGFIQSIDSAAYEVDNLTIGRMTIKRTATVTIST